MIFEDLGIIFIIPQIIRNLKLKDKANIHLSLNYYRTQEIQLEYNQNEHNLQKNNV